MREATGELNITLVIVTLVAALVSFFYFVLWPNIDANQKGQSYCNKAICTEEPDENGMVKNCKYTDEKGREKTISCKYKG